MLPVAYVQSELAFSNTEDTLVFLEEMHAVYADPNTRTKIDCKESQAAFLAVWVSPRCDEYGLFSQGSHSSCAAGVYF